MLKKIILSMVCCGALTAVPCHASDVVFGPYQPLFLGFNSGLDSFYGPYRPSESSFEAQSYLYQQDQGVTLQFAGKKEEGALSFFVAADSFSVQENDPFVEGLNAISPAAGIQFTMDFSL